MSKCGTYAGWGRHKRDGTELDQECKDAAAAYMREYRATLKRMHMRRQRIVPNAHSNKNAMRDTPTSNYELRQSEIELVVQRPNKTARQLLPTTVIRA